MGGESGHVSGVVRAPIEKIIEAMLDFDAQPDWQSSMSKCVVLERDDEGRGLLVEETMDAKIRTITYVVRYTYDLPRALTWQRVSGDLKDIRGSYRFTPLADGSTEVGLDITFDVGFFVPGPIKNKIRDQSLRQFMKELRRRVE